MWVTFFPSSENDDGSLAGLLIQFTMLTFTTAAPDHGCFETALVMTPPCLTM